MANQIENIGFPAPAPSRITTLRDFAWIATIALIYFTVGSLSMKLAFKPEGVAAVWPGSGIFLSAVLLTRAGLRSLLVGILFLIDLLIGLYIGTPTLVSLTYALSLAFDASFSAWILLKMFGSGFSFYKVRDVLGFIFMSVFLSNALSASLASLAPFYSLKLPFWHTWKLVWSSNGIGNLLVTPFIMSWAGFTMKKLPKLNFRLILEIAALYLSILLLNDYIFRNLSGNINFLSIVNYFTFPFLIWAALRFGVRGVSAASITLAVNILYYALTSKIAIFNNETRLDSVVLVQLYLAILSISSLILATVVSERKLASDALRISEEQFRNFFEHSVVGKSITSLDGKLKTNQAFCQIVGYSEDELNQLKWQDITHPDDIEPNEKAISSIISGEKQSVRFEKRYVHKDGSIVWADVNTALQRNKDGEPLYFITAIIDITEHKLAEDKIVKANRIYAVISQINKTIVRTRDRNELFKESCRIAVENGKFQMAWIGLADRETKLVIPFTFAGFEENYLTNINKISYDDIPSGRGPTGRSIRENTHIVCDDFENNPLMTPWRDEALKRGYLSSIALPISLFGEVIGAFTIYASVPHFFDEEETDLLVKVASDISFALEAMENEKKREEAETEIKKLNETLELRVEQRTAQLEAANRELEAFSYSVSHDLRAPLRHINGFINLLLENKTSPLTSDELHYLDIVSKASDEMGKLIDALLSFSRLNRSEIHKVPVDSLHLVEQSLQIYEDEIRQREIEIKVGPLPEIHGDILLIGQVWTNLISNAIKYTGKTGKPRIEIGSYLAPNETVFYIKDNGAGFNMKYADKLFGVFQRLHKQSDFDGIGIGLANINRIISRHGGRCWAEGEIDKGATFYFSLPDK